MKRNIIQIDEEKCNGCGQCLPTCHEGALRIIDGKARLISDLFCDGLGACLGHCPEGAIEIIEREAEPYNESKVIATLVTKGKSTVLAHLDHLRTHNEQEFLNEAIKYLTNNNIDMKIDEKSFKQNSGFGCPGSLTKDFRDDSQKKQISDDSISGKPLEIQSELRQWPVQLHLLNPQAPFFKNADVVLAADCAAFAMGNFHARFLNGKSLAIACPKLDSNKESYIEKLSDMIALSKINSLNAIMMEVPCCSGLLQMAKMAREEAGRNIPIKQIFISIHGEVLEEEWT